MYSQDRLNSSELAVFDPIEAVEKILYEVAPPGGRGIEQSRSSVLKPRTIFARHWPDTKGGILNANDSIRHLRPLSAI